MIQYVIDNDNNIYHSHYQDQWPMSEDIPRTRNSGRNSGNEINLPNPRAILRDYCSIFWVESPYNAIPHNSFCGTIIIDKDSVCDKTPFWSTQASFSANDSYLIWGGSRLCYPIVNRIRNLLLYWWGQTPKSKSPVCPPWYRSLVILCYNVFSRYLFWNRAVALC